jgi:thiamine thiazole synthase
MSPIFTDVTDADISKAIVERSSRQIADHVRSDCVIVGSGPSGLVAARELGRSGYKVVLLERNNYLGGGFWIGGFLMNTLTLRSPANSFLDELKVPYDVVKKGLFATDGPLACSKLIASACESGIFVMNLVSVHDVVMQEDGQVSGVVVNWTPVSSMPRNITCVDPISLETKVVIDATGHEASVATIAMNKTGQRIKGEGPMCAQRSEDAVVKMTGKVMPGLYATGMSVAAIHGLPRMGPTFGGMLMSGKRCADLVKKELGKA